MVHVRHGSLRIALVIAAFAATQACAVEEGSSLRPRLGRSMKQGADEVAKSGDPCAPGRAPSLLDDPSGTCATATEYHVPMLGIASAKTSSATDIGTRTLKTLDLAGADAPSCAGAGDGIDTCGPNGDQSCCHATTVPGGKAANLDVATFDLGVYEVTTGRFEKFVEAANGDLRGLASASAWDGWKPEYTQKLPASRAEVDDTLGPSCQFRSNVREFGALTWPSADIEAAVAEFITDDNDDAKDIRADATAPRLRRKPINCTSWWMAAAFCAWDGGRLPTPDEWTYAAIGGDELRTYAWPNAEPRTPAKVVTDFNLDTNSFTWPEGFPFYDNGFNAYHIAPPGRKPEGVARWGQHDMAGNLVEWTSANFNNQFGIARGGSWEGHPDINTNVYNNYPLDRTYGSLGFRCAYGAAPAPKPQAPANAKTNIFRAVDAANAQHLFATAAPAAGVAEGVRFRLFAEDQGGSLAINACVTAAGHHFVSSDANCEGHTVEARLGFALPAAATEMMPLYRCLGQNGDHVSTVTPEECKRAGYAVEGLQGWVFGPPPSDFIASLYREGLGRAPEEAGHVAWLDFVTRGGCNAGRLAELIEGILESDEFNGLNLDPAAKVDRLYKAALSREAEPEGRANAEAFLAGGGSWKTLVHSTATSAEATNLSAPRCAP